MRSLARGLQGGFLARGFTKGGHIWRPILRKVCERTLLLMVWLRKNSTARWLEKLVMKEFLCGLCLEGVGVAFWAGFHKGRSYMETNFEKSL